MFFELLKRMGLGFAIVWIVSPLVGLTMVGLVIYILIRIVSRI